MPLIDVDHFIKGLKEYFDTENMVELVNQLTTGGFKLKKIVVAVSLVLEAVKAVEQLAADLDDLDEPVGKQKREAVVKFLDDTFDLPFYLEPFDDNIIGMVVDAIVLYYNTKIGHGWLGIVKQFL